MNIISVKSENKENIHKAIKNSMSNEVLVVCNLLDACGCTGNGTC